jgi:hypothetical protein
MNDLSPILRKALCLLISALYLGFVLLYDLESNYQTISPALLSMGLLLASILMKPAWVFFWGTIYSLMVIQILLNILPIKRRMLSLRITLPQIQVIELYMLHSLCLHFFISPNKSKEKSEYIEPYYPKHAFSCLYFGY